MTASALIVVPTTAHHHHDTGHHHPERPERLVAVEGGLVDSEVELVTLPERAATTAELERVHQLGYLRRLQQFIESDGGDLDADTPTSIGSWRSAVYGAGAVLAAVDGLRAGAGSAAFVACRPPGHHATPNRAMGFCLLNNVAVAAAALAEADERVLILDWDAHHGNGTQDIFWDDARVLYVSLHEWPAYPGTGRASETGGPAAPGLTINVPLPSGATGDVAREALDQIVAPAVDQFAPTWLLISAGFDAHRADPLASLAWSAGDYRDLTRWSLGLVPTGRTLAVLEGGYDLTALRRSVAATASALTGGDLCPEPPTSGGPGAEDVERARQVRLQQDVA